MCDHQSDQKKFNKVVEEFFGDNAILKAMLARFCPEVHERGIRGYRMFSPNTFLIWNGRDHGNGVSYDFDIIDVNTYKLIYQNGKSCQKKYKNTILTLEQLNKFINMFDKDYDFLDKMVAQRGN